MSLSPGDPDAQARAAIEQEFPGLRVTPWRISSPTDPAYNCFAHSFGDNQMRWLPFGQFEWWPHRVPRSYELASFLALARHQGFEPCDDGDMQPGFTKVAFYGSRDRVRHAARQLPDGRWQSKLGLDHDIEHDLLALVGEEYGSLLAVVRKKV